MEFSVPGYVALNNGDDCSIVLDEIPDVKFLQCEYNVSEQTIKVRNTGVSKKGAINTLIFKDLPSEWLAYLPKRETFKLVFMKDSRLSYGLFVNKRVK